MLQLKEMEHVYFSGSQHRDTQLYRLASFNATLYFLQNSEAHLQYPVTEEKLARLKAAFLPPEVIVIHSKFCLWSTPTLHENTHDTIHTANTMLTHDASFTKCGFLQIFVVSVHYDEIAQSAVNFVFIFWVGRAHLSIPNHLLYTLNTHLHSFQHMTHFVFLFFQSLLDENVLVEGVDFGNQRKTPPEKKPEDMLVEKPKPVLKPKPDVLDVKPEDLTSSSPRC